MKATVEVARFVTVEVPDSFLTEEFLEEFRQYFYPFESREDHLIHLAELFANGLVHGDSFIEGYGRAKEIGIRFEVEEVASELAHLV